MVINFKSRRANGPLDGKYDYSRKIQNFTGMTIRITDRSGRTQVISSSNVQPHSSVSRDLIITEWYRTHQVSDMVDIDHELKVDMQDKQRYGTYEGVELDTVIPIDIINSNVEGIYVENLDLIIAVYDKGTPMPHPRFYKNMKDKVYNKNLLTLSVELCDTQSQYGTMYANIGGMTYRIIPTRVPVPDHDGFIISQRLVGDGLYISERYSFEDLTEGPGKEGIRVYSSIYEAEKDIRNPDRSKYQTNLVNFDKEKEALIKAAEARGYERSREEIRSVGKAIERIRVQTDDKTDKYKRTMEKALYEVDKLKRGMERLRQKTDDEITDNNRATTRLIEEKQRACDAAIEEAERKRKAAEIEAEEVKHKAREKERKEKTGFLASILKAVSAVVGFFTSIFAF